MADQEKQFNFELDFIDDKKVRDICNDNYILFVGSESILEGEDEVSVDINKYIRNEFDLSSFNEIIGDVEKQKEVFRCFQEKDLNLINIKSKKKPEFSKGLENLLKTRLFKIVFTTTISRSLETLMDNVWDKGNYDIKVYWANRDNTFWADLRKAKKPTLVYLFGRADIISNPENRFVCYDDASFPFMRALMFDMFRNNSPMQKFLKGKKILSLGCQFDDWYSRFFWFILTDGLSGTNAENVFVLSKNNKTPQKKLSLFFDRNESSVKNYSASIAEFSEQLERYFNARKSLITEWIIKPTMENSGIFLSYAGEKRSDVRKLFFKLKEKKYDVCLSDIVIPNDGYPADIAQKYKNKKLYVIVLTPEIKELLESDNTVDIIKEKLKNEYNKILENNKPILLLAVNGYSFAGDYHQKLIEIYGQRSGINLMADGGWEQFTSFLEWINKSKEPNPKSHDVFISYFNANSVDAHFLFKQLKHMNPWLDYYYLAGVKDWDESIHEAIKKSKVFVSLLTYEVMQHLKTLINNNSSEEVKRKAIRYYQKEIEWAIDAKIPIVLYSRNNYQFTSEYHDYLVNKIKLGDKINGIGKQNDNHVDGFGKSDTRNLEDKIKELLNKQ